MVEQFMQMDTRLFLFINNSMHFAWADAFFPYLTQLSHWFTPLTVLFVWMAFFSGKKGRRVLLILLLTVAVTDFINTRGLKKTIERPRPALAVQGTAPLVDAYGYSFPSGHAANMFAACLLLGLIYRRWLWPLLALASLVAFSRVYVGVHYPSDVLAGAVLGALLAGLAFRLTRRFSNIEN